MIHAMQAAIFDLDGVIVDTAKYHFLAWKRLAHEMGFDFSEKDNERLKGVSRDRSLEILLEIGGKTVDAAARQALAERKNGWYVEYIQRMDRSELLAGTEQYLDKIRRLGIKTALGSASKNAPIIIDRLGIAPLFDTVIDGTQVTRAKPDPEVFQRAAAKLGILPQNCVVFEDAVAGIQAALRAGMGAVGIGKPGNLPEADVVIEGLYQLVILGVGEINSINW